MTKTVLSLSYSVLGFVSNFDIRISDFLRVYMFDGLVNRFHGHEAQPPIKPYGAFVLRGHFQINAADAGLAESLQGVEEQDRAQTAVAMLRAMPRFWIAPSPLTSRIPCTVPQNSGSFGPRL